MGAFEALQWAWYMLRGYREKPYGIEEARKNIQEILLNMGKGIEVDFEAEINKYSVHR
jgi:hypothetical protein